VKKLRVTVNGIEYDVQVELQEDDGVYAGPTAPAAAPRPAAPPPAPAATPTPPPAPAATPAPAPAAPSGGKNLESPIAGIVVAIKAQVGDSVQAGDPVIVIEAMKMNTNVNAPFAGRVSAIHVKQGDGVKSKQVLLTFE
jgi:biotin carboxyl carrier protein